MPLVHMDGYDDRRNITDGWTEGDETYSGWGLYQFLHDQQDDPAIYNGTRQETRYGGWALCCLDTDGHYESWSLFQYFNPDGNTDFHIGLAYYGTANPWEILFWKQDVASGSQGICTIQANNNGELLVKVKVADYDWNHIIHTKPNLLKGWTPGYIEVSIGIGKGAGNDYLKIWHNGEQIVNESGITLSYDGLITSVRAPNIAGNVDDFFFYSGNSPFPQVGEVRIHALMPNGAGTNSDFTPSSGANFECVDEYDQDFDTTHNSSDGTSGHRDDFEIENLSGVTNVSSTVKALQVKAMVTCSASEQVRLYVDIGGTRYYSPAFSPGSTAYEYIQYIWETNPSTSSPWTVAQLDAVKVGYEVV